MALTFQTSPGGLQVAVNGGSYTASATVTVIVGSSNTVTAVSPQTKNRQMYVFQSWSDNGAQSHTIIAPASASTYTARYKRR